VKGIGFVTVRSQMKVHFCTEYWITIYKYLILAYAKQMIAFTFRSILVSYLRPGKIQ